MLFIVNINNNKIIPNYCLFKKQLYICTRNNKHLKKIIMITINYHGVELNYNENQTVSNCIDLGFSTELIKKIISIIRSENIDYLGYRKLEKYRNL